MNDNSLTTSIDDSNQRRTHQGASPSTRTAHKRCAAAAHCTRVQRACATDQRLRKQIRSLCTGHRKRGPELGPPGGPNTCDGLGVARRRGCVLPSTCEKRDLAPMCLRTQRPSGNCQNMRSDVRTAKRWWCLVGVASPSSLQSATRYTEQRGSRRPGPCKPARSGRSRGRDDHCERGRLHTLPRECGLQYVGADGAGVTAA